MRTSILLIMFIAITISLAANPIPIMKLGEIHLLDDQGNWQIKFHETYLQFEYPNIPDTTSYTLNCNAGSFTFTKADIIAAQGVVSSISLNSNLRFNTQSDSISMKHDYEVCKYGTSKDVNPPTSNQYLKLVEFNSNHSDNYIWALVNSNGDTHGGLDITLKDSQNNIIENAKVVYLGYTPLGSSLTYYRDGHYKNSDLPAKNHTLRIFVSDTLRKVTKVTVDPDETTSEEIILENYVSPHQSIDDDLIEKSDIAANYPNPFNPETSIVFSLKKQFSDVQVDIFNTRGQVVKRLNVEDTIIGENTVKWNGRNGQNRKVSSGTYYYRIKAEGSILTVNKMLLLK